MTNITSTPQHVLLQFNKISGAYITCLSYVDPASLDQTYYVYAEVSDFIIDAQTVIGNYPEFKIVNNVDQKPKVYETVLNMGCRSKIVSEYSPETQLDRIRVVVEQIAVFLDGKYKSLEIEGLEALQEMNAFIDEIKESNRKLKESYKARDDFEYITIAEEIAQRDAQLEGGLHELVYGPRLLKV